MSFMVTLVTLIHAMFARFGTEGVIMTRNKVLVLCQDFTIPLSQGPYLLSVNGVLEKKRAKKRRLFFGRRPEKKTEEK